MLNVFGVYRSVNATAHRRLPLRYDASFTFVSVVLGTIQTFISKNINCICTTFVQRSIQIKEATLRFVLCFVFSLAVGVVLVLCHC